MPPTTRPCSAELKAHGGATTLALRQKLAAKAYARTAAYDAAISNWFAQQLGDAAPAFRAFGGKLAEALRYGENPHQPAAFYRAPASAPRRRHRAAGAGQAALLQQHQRHRRGLRMRRRVRRRAAPPPASSSSTPIPAASPRATSLLDAYRKALRLRSGLGLRRHRRAQPHARRRGRARDHRDLHRGHHRARRQRGGDRHRRREEEPAPAAGRRPARSARRRA